MEPRFSRNFLLTKTLRRGALLLCLLAPAVSVLGNGNVVVRENVSAVRREELAKKLQAITGLRSLGFDKFGLLQLGTDQGDHVYIYRLRAKLTTFGLQIETMVNVGYRLLTAPNH